MKYYALYNPLAANGAAKTDAFKVRDLMVGDTIDFVDMTKITSYEELFGEMEKDSAIIICGGDGTLNRFVNDISELPDKDILYYACGTGNDFLVDIGGKKGDKPIKINEYLCDLPTVTVKGKTYKFINGIGYGIDGYCCEVGDKYKEKSNKPANYTAIAIKGLLFHYKPTNAKVTVDGQEYNYKKTWLVPTMNGRMYGGGMIPTPDQNRLGDGSLSTMIYSNAGKIAALTLFPKIFEGKHIENKKVVEVKKGRYIKVEFDRPVALQIDGETVLSVTEYECRAGK